MLASRYKPHDPLAEELIRTFRHQEFHGKYYIDKYDALISGKKETNVNILLPRAHSRKEPFDEVALYGFRSAHPDLFYLSPWEFVQWFKPHRLQPPSSTYAWSVLTAEGKWKHKDAGQTGAVLKPGVDYVLNEKLLSRHKHIHVYPATSLVSINADRYAQFRNTWLLMRRVRPVVPCPQQCPLPNHRME